MNNKGFSLIFMIFLIGILFIMGSIITRVMLNVNSSIYFQKDKLAAFYLAEAAIEFGKSEIHKNPSWYTDSTCSGNLVEWLRNTARGDSIINNSKTVKEFNKDALYGIGFSGKSCVIIKFENGVLEEI